MNIKKRIFTTLLLSLHFIQLFAQPPGLPGDCEDADDCEAVPLDNWLIVLFAAGLIFTAWYLHNKQKKEALV